MSFLESCAKSCQPRVSQRISLLIQTPPTNQRFQMSGDKKKAQAEVESNLSHSVAKVGPFATSSTGAISKDDPARQEGSWNQTIGSAKSAVGGLVGAQGLKAEGDRQYAEGQGQEAQGQLSDLGGGAAERVRGAAGAAMAGLTGDRAAQAEYQARHDVGKTQQRSAEADIQKQANV